MSVTKGVMVNGGFNLTFRSDTPGQLLDATDIASNAFAHIIITPTWQPSELLTPSVLLGKSIFTGVLFGNRARYQISGLHATSWLGDPNGIGDVNERTPADLTLNFKDWLQAILSGQDALAEGSITDIEPSEAMLWDPQKLTPRAMFDQVIDYFRDATGNPSIEWQVSDALTVNAGTVADLFTETARAFLTDSFDGHDPTTPGLNATLEFTDDVDDYITRLLYIYTGGGAIGVDGATTPYSDGYGNPVARKRTASNDQTTFAQATSVAGSIVAREDAPRRQLVARTDRRAVFSQVPVGGYVYAWDQEQRIIDLAYAVPWRGTIANPTLVRVMEATMPFEAGMGCYLLVEGDTVYDLSRWIVPESPGAVLKLGALDRPLVY